MRKTIYIIPGYKHDISTPGYRELKESLEEKGYSVVVIKISWKYHVMSDYIREVREQVIPGKDSIILGFSFGAMITLKLAEESKFKEVFLCSLSPYFAEDLHLFPKYYMLTLGIRRWRDFGKNYSEKSIENKLQNSYVSIYGSDESQRLRKRNKRMIERLGIEKVSYLKGVGHDIAHQKYLDVILKYM